jgi:ribonuclease VapC
MIVVDSSSLVAIVLGEADAEEHLAQMRSAKPLVSAVSRLDAGIVVEARQGPDATRDLVLLLDGTGAEVVAFDEQHSAAAMDAWRRFGKGRHPAGLNFGDCAAYATARIAGMPLLFKGDDFSQTDIPTVL